jgi:hypothetical protein
MFNRRNIIRILIIQSVITAIVLQNTKAQTLVEFKKMPAPQKAKLVSDSLKIILHLGDLQYPKVYDILLEGTMKAQPIIQADCNKMSKGYKLRSLLSEEETKLQAVLTKFQYELYQKKKQELIARFKANKKDKDILFDKM